MSGRSSYKARTAYAFTLLLLLVGPGMCRSIPDTGSGQAEKAPHAQIPNFDHIVVIAFENKEFEKIIDNPFMPTFNVYALGNTVLTQYHAVAHPSLPNYIAMISGDTFGIDSNCEDCFIDAPSLPDLIEASGRTWRAYQEDMPQPCGLDNYGEHGYVQHHNPFVYFDPIRLDPERCKKSVVPLEALETDIQAGDLPNFMFITPNMCHNSHDCNLLITDGWLMGLLARLIPALENESQNYLVVLNWDEGDGNGSCCGLPESAGGRIPVVLISPLVKHAFQDPTPYTHYSLLKTISKGWGLPELGQAGEANEPLILEPWK
jgi:hypothetical protein